MYNIIYVSNEGEQVLVEGVTRDELGEILLSVRCAFPGAFARKVL